MGYYVHLALSGFDKQWQTHWNHGKFWSGVPPRSRHHQLHNLCFVIFIIYRTTEMLQCTHDRHYASHASYLWKAHLHIWGVRVMRVHRTWWGWECRNPDAPTRPRAAEKRNLRNLPQEDWGDNPATPSLPVSPSAWAAHLRLQLARITHADHLRVWSQQLHALAIRDLHLYSPDKPSSTAAAAATITPGTGSFFRAMAVV